MIAVGIDIAKHTHEACFLSPDGQELGKSLRFRDDRPGVQALLARGQQLPAAATIGLEATGHYWLALYDALVQAGLTVQVLNPLQAQPTAGRRCAKSRMTARMPGGSPM